MSDTYVGVCLKCKLETDLIEGFCEDCFPTDEECKDYWENR